MAEKVRTPARRFPSVPTVEGAGVHLRRSFSNPQVPLFDPFLLLDHFGSTNPADYLAGFPWHPHRGIETVTYVLHGRVDHGDTLGNRGTISDGDVQWMNSGSGIVHQEMPRQTEGEFSGFQLWVNLPAREKMSSPAYRGLTAGDIPAESTPDGGKVHIVAGSYGSTEGPVRGISVEPTYLDISLPPDARFELPTSPGHTVFTHQVDGTLSGPDGSWPAATAGETLLFDDGDRFRAQAGPGGGRFLFVTGRPLHEPVAWYGPIVMNRGDEIQTALQELRHGQFIKERRPVLEE